ncbi:MAG: FecR domain-containing protein [Candidatus Oleimicrobiaceae bacterium]
MENRSAGRMITLGIMVAMGTGAIALIAKAPVPEEVSTKGRVAYVEGMAKRRGLESEDWENAYQNTAVIDGDKVRTFRQSRAELELTELDLVRMAPQTTIDIVRLYEEKKAQRRGVAIAVQEGDIWANVEGEVGEVDFKIKTPKAAAAITGTTVRVGVASDSTTELRVYKGQVSVTNAPERTDLKPQFILPPQEVPAPYEVPGPHEVSLEEWFYIVKSMQKIKIDRAGRVVEAGGFSTTDPEEQSEWVRWNLRRDRQRGVQPQR